MPTKDVPEGGFFAEDSLEHEFHREQSAFLGLLPSLLKTHHQRYVAIVSGQLVDDDDDEIRLAERIEQRFRDRFVLIRGVTETEIEDDLPSPEIEAR